MKNKHNIISYIGIIAVVISLFTMVKHEVRVVVKKTMAQQEIIKKKSGESFTVADGLFLWHCIEQDSVCDVDAYYTGLQTPFSRSIGTTGVKLRSTETGFSGQDVYYKYCSNCHQNGVMNAPRVLPDKPMYILLNHAIYGYEGDLGQMPARGTCVECTDEDLESAILWMKTNLKPNK